VQPVQQLPAPSTDLRRALEAHSPVVGFLLATSRVSDGWTVYGVLIEGTAVLRIASVLVSVVVLVANLLRVQGTLKF
jgi:hypothetical protein